MDIELAKPEDLIQVYALGTASFIENELENTTVTINLDKALASLAACINNQMCFVSRDKTNPKHINGILALAPNQPWFSTDMVLIGLVVYIKPEHRTFGLAKSLLSRAKEYAIMNKIPLAFDLFTQKDAPKKKRLLKYLGFEEWGSSYLYIPK